MELNEAYLEKLGWRQDDLGYFTHEDICWVVITNSTILGQIQFTLGVLSNEFTGRTSFRGFSKNLRTVDDLRLLYSALFGIEIVCPQ